MNIAPPSQGKYCALLIGSVIGSPSAPARIVRQRARHQPFRSFDVGLAAILALARRNAAVRESLVARL
jgi:hypothetical protein